MCCDRGKIKLLDLKKPPEVLEQLLFGSGHKSSHFRENIRSYNSIFSFTSMGVSRGQDINKLHAEIISDLKQMLDDNNVLAKTFRMVRDQFQENIDSNVKFRLIGKRGIDGRRYNLPTIPEVDALVVGDFEVSGSDRDIIIETQSGQLQRINELNVAYLGLQYPLLFPYGEDGYREDIPLSQGDQSSRGRQCISMREFFAYKIQERKDEVPTVVSSGRLFQQFLVDGYKMIESSRLKLIRTHQKQLRVDSYKVLEDAILHSDIDPSSQEWYPVYRRRDNGRTIMKNGIHWITGNDSANTTFSQSTHDNGSSSIDEINMYYDCRYISPCEAAWRIFKFPIHHREPSVERLSFHLPNEQSVIFSGDDPIVNVANRLTVKESIYACYAFGLLDDDKEYVDAIKEAGTWGMPSYLRQLFVMLLLSNSLSHPKIVWQSSWQLLPEDILREERTLLSNPEAELTDDELKNRCLKKLDRILKGCGKSFNDFPTMPRPYYNEEEFDGANRLRGRIAHSRFPIPLNPTEDSTCNIKQGSPLAKLIVKAKLIIWDEAPMMHKYCFEALDRTLRDFLRFKDPSNLDRPFGGKTIVLGGDFRQILLVITKGARQEIVKATLNSSYLWPHCQVLKLTTNMRLQGNISGADLDDLKEFSDWILAIGDGNIGCSIDGIEKVEIPDDLLIHNYDDPISRIVESTYSDFLRHFTDIKYLQERAILAPTLQMVESVNDYMVSLNNSQDKSYLSSDTICKSDHAFTSLEHIHTPEFLNSIKCSGIPNHSITLKVGVPVMLLRNIDQSSGLCNGTRLIITRLGNRVIEAKVLSGNMVGDKVCIPRMTLTPSNARIPFKFQRRQFPVIVSFAMTINKSQGQALCNVGLFLKKPVFNHGQLYIALSRVLSRKGLKILCYDEDNK
ncbi:uncharacterized protein LOC142165026 [Nicotiana tabacum]|uniref:Uncharacterized protein LOC142165026 n=1 Tax=Nicotiana tabacum TaxID=4097 RepID=A0AC58S474_TOBAC